MPGVTKYHAGHEPTWWMLDSTWSIRKNQWADPQVWVISGPRDKRSNRIRMHVELPKNWDFSPFCFDPDLFEIGAYNLG